MRGLPTRWSMALLMSAMLLLPARGLLAQGTGPGATQAERDTREVEQYTLTVDKVNRLSQLLTDAAAALKSDPSLRNSLDLDGGDGHASLDAMTKQLAGSPVLTALLAKNGFQPHEFAVMTVALLQASLGLFSKPKDVPVEQYAAKIHANPANLLFVQGHAAELGEVHRKAMALDPDGAAN